MKIPKQFLVNTPELLSVLTKCVLYASKYGCPTVDHLFDVLAARDYKQNNRYVGKFLINKVCAEFQITEYQLFESSGRKELTDARKVYAVIAAELFELNNGQIAASFGRSRHFVKRAKTELFEYLSTPAKSPYQKGLVEAYKRVHLQVKAYLLFEPKSGKKKDNNSEDPNQ